MKFCNLSSMLSTVALLVAPEIALGQFSFNAIGQQYTQDFNSFVGTQASLPAHWSHLGDGNDIFRGVFNSTTNSAADFTGVMAATNGVSGNSIVWRESTGPANLDEFRLLFAVTNNTGQDITKVQFTYDLEAWVNGRRDNELRFKYDTFIEPVDAGRPTFETDILPRNSAFTRNPNHTPIGSNDDQFVLDGSLPENRTQVVGTLDLTTYLISENDPGLGVFGPLGPGETAYFRWQISNNQLTAGNRSALGINNLTLTAIPEPTGLGGLALLGVAVSLSRRRRRSE